MKPIYYISLLFLFFAQESFSQDQSPRRVRQRETETSVENNTPTLTDRAKIKNEEASKSPAHVVWLREVYRYIDLEKESNAPLYYPIQPIGNRVNLFTLIFRLVSEGKVTAYKYLDGRESFTEDQKVNFETDVLKRLQILYTTQGTGDNAKFVVDDSDIPSAEVLIYMIKEGWYFDEATGSFKTQVTALCPLLVREDYYVGGTTRDALFWIPYENLRPYLSRELIMTSNYNNTLTYSIDDYFMKGMYSGEITKTTNLMNQTLAQQIGSDDPEVIKQAQDSIDTQLKGFNKELWIYNDSIPLNTDKSKSTKGEKKTKVNKRGEKQEKTSSRSEKASSANRSVRRR